MRIKSYYDRSPMADNQKNQDLSEYLMNAPRRWFATVFTAFFLITGSGCATTSSVPGAKDPFENINRSIHKFNIESDRVFLKPIAKGYANAFPQPIRNGVKNFFSNLWEPMTVVNDLLQGKFGQAASDSFRFLVNSTAGILGIFDVATHLYLPKHREDFGQTLGVWGIPSGPYLVLPFLGPSNVRDTTGLIPQYLYADTLGILDTPEVYYAAGIRLVDARSRLLGLDELLAIQPDEYLFLRETYRQQRYLAIHDGNPPATDEEDSDEDLIDQLLKDD